MIRHEVAKVEQICELGKLTASFVDNTLCKTEAIVVANVVRCSVRIGIICHFFLSKFNHVIEVVGIRELISLNRTALS